MLKPVEIDVVRLILAGALLALASYFQAISGFGLGMIVMGLNGVFQIWSLPQAAVMVSVATLANAVAALRKRPAHFPGQSFRFALLGLIPAVLGGIWLLYRLAATSTAALQTLLGAMIVYGSLSLFFNPRRQIQPSPPSSFVLAGFASGLMGGLFAVSGPPLIYHSYRQPWQLAQIRAFLLAIFALLAVVRLGHDLLLGYMQSDMISFILTGVPAVLAGSWLGCRKAHTYAPELLKKSASAILLVLGSGLLIQGVAVLL